MVVLHVKLIKVVHNCVLQFPFAKSFLAKNFYRVWINKNRKGSNRDYMIDVRPPTCEVSIIFLFDLRYHVKVLLFTIPELYGYDFAGRWFRFEFFVNQRLWMFRFWCENVNPSFIFGSDVFDERISFFAIGWEVEVTHSFDWFCGSCWTFSAPSESSSDTTLNNTSHFRNFTILRRLNSFLGV